MRRTGTLCLFGLFYLLASQLVAGMAASAPTTWGSEGWAGVLDVAPDKDSSSERLGKFIHAAATEALKDRDSFSIAFSGGSQIQVRRQGAPGSPCRWARIPQLPLRSKCTMG